MIPVYLPMMLTRINRSSVNYSKIDEELRQDNEIEKLVPDLERVGTSDGFGVYHSRGLNRKQLEVLKSAGYKYGHWVKEGCKKTHHRGWRKFK